MNKGGHLRRRVDAITTAFSGTFAGKLSKLTEDQRRTYDKWRTESASFCASYPGGEAFARMISSEGPPPLRRDVRTALFGTIIEIPADATEDEAAEIYGRVVRGE